MFQTQLHFIKVLINVLTKAFF